MKPNGRDEDGVVFDDAQATRGTERALLCRLTTDRGERREVWVPRSQITDDSEVFEVGDDGKLVVKSWFAEREGLA